MGLLIPEAFPGGKIHKKSTSHRWLARWNAGPTRARRSVSKRSNQRWFVLTEKWPVWRDFPFMRQTRHAPTGCVQAKRLVAGIGQRHSVAKTAMIVMILRAMLFMFGIARFAGIMVMLRMIVHRRDDFTGISRECTRLKAGANAEQQQPCEQPTHRERTED